MLPGYTHNIINLSETEDLVTVMYCNEVFNPGKPDTFFEKVYDVNMLNVKRRAVANASAFFVAFPIR